jgi:hypothetical protein
MPRLVEVVADYGPDDLAQAELRQRLGLAVPGADLQLTTVPYSDTLAAGFCVARLALTPGPSDRIVAHDVWSDDAAAETWLCAARTRDGVWIVGPNGGFSWSFVAGRLTALCHLDVSAGASRLAPRQGLPLAIGHLARGHPHAISEVVSPETVRALPERVVAYVDTTGDITTTMRELPGAVGERVDVRIGRVSAQATVAALDRPVPRGELVLSARDAPPPLVEVVLGGGSAAEHFERPAPGTAVRVGAA